MSNWKNDITPGEWEITENCLGDKAIKTSEEEVFFEARKPKRYYTDYPVIRIDEDGNEWKALSNEKAREYGNYVPSQETIDQIKSEQEANAQLIAEAGTVTNETGKTPRELQKERDEVLAALRGLLDNRFVYENDHIIDLEKAKSIIAKIEGEQT
jgi:hypothetical protein